MRKGSKQASPTTGAAASDEGSDELLFSPSQFQFDAHANANTNNVVVVTVPPPAHGGGASSGFVSPRSPGPVGMMPSMSSMAATPDSVMSPDALLRAYAERRATSSHASSSSTPVNAVNGMRSANNTPAPLVISSPISPPVSASASASTPYSLSSPVTPNYDYGNYGNYSYGNYAAANGVRTLYSPAGSGVRTQPGGRESVYSVGGNEEDAYGGHV